MQFLSIITLASAPPNSVALRPTELELELLDDIITDSIAHIPNFLIEQKIKLIKDFNKNEWHDFLVFAVYDGF